MVPNDNSMGKDIAERHIGVCSLLRLHVEGSPVVLAEAVARGLSVIDEVKSLGDRCKRQSVQVEREDGSVFWLPSHDLPGRGRFYFKSQMGQ
ncbi:hypothetical protein [Kyrpidia tusciae]|uniref:Uncharacterized protein n=1 Tax=Kyrpidia tusciae (strain DSM 2912 / NBRC 15312 / T2) TaxID=562970 RepID=D5WVN1_KYRT2|nr:hypothetical protein [Kyrpidia tusciae]ADG07574.1 hypothetical protein Btus_2942 [Kyrpidia tusciae DSM 2912]